MLKLIRRVVGGIAVVALISGATAFAQSRVGTPQSGVPGIVNTMDEIKARQAAYDIANAGKPITYFEKPYRTVDRTKLKQNPDSPAGAQGPRRGATASSRSRRRPRRSTSSAATSPTPWRSRRTRWAPSARRSSSWRSTGASARSTRCPAPPTACSTSRPTRSSSRRWCRSAAHHQQPHVGSADPLRPAVAALVRHRHRHPQQRHGVEPHRDGGQRLQQHFRGDHVDLLLHSRHPGRRLHRLPDAGHRRQRAVHRRQHLHHRRPVPQHRRVGRAQVARSWPPARSSPRRSTT